MLRLLADLLRPYRRNVGIIVTAMLAQSAMSLAAPWPLKIILDSVVGHTRVPAWMANWLLPLRGGDSKRDIATLAAIIFVAIAAVGGAAFYITSYLTDAVGQWVANDLRLRTYLPPSTAAVAELLRQPPGGHDPEHHHR